MAGIDSGNTVNAASNGKNKQSGEYDKEPCPLCGEDVKLLPPHLRNDCDNATGPTYE